MSVWKCPSRVPSAPYAQTQSDLTLVRVVLDIQETDSTAKVCSCVPTQFKKSCFCAIFAILVLSCNELEEPEYGSMRSTLDPPFSGGDIVVFSCDRGFILNGQQKLKCDPSSLEWSGSVPTCRGKAFLSWNGNCKCRTETDTSSITNLR